MPKQSKKLRQINRRDHHGSYKRAGEEISPETKRRDTLSPKEEANEFLRGLERETINGISVSTYLEQQLKALRGDIDNLNEAMSNYALGQAQEVDRRFQQMNAKIANLQAQVQVLQNHRPTPVASTPLAKDSSSPESTISKQTRDAFFRRQDPLITPPPVAPPPLKAPKK